ncbi:hypothetical protein J6590_004074 [Homalodisca vitripennis]|nr:hypothetical protein J6590_004074 [Homalodisca vitripennis]
MRGPGTENKSQISAAHLTRSLSLLGTKNEGRGGGRELQMFFTVYQMISVTTLESLFLPPPRAPLSSPITDCLCLRLQLIVYTVLDIYISLVNVVMVSNAPLLSTARPIPDCVWTCSSSCTRERCHGVKRSTSKYCQAHSRLCLDLQLIVYTVLDIYISLVNVVMVSNAPLVSTARIRLCLDLQLIVYTVLDIYISLVNVVMVSNAPLLSTARLSVFAAAAHRVHGT